MKTQPLTPYLIPTNTLEGALFIDHTGTLIVNPKSNIQFKDCKYRHLYLANNDEIKEGDWIMAYKDTNEGSFLHKVTKISFPNLKAEDKKIILCTDPKLIADGVLPIDGNTGAMVHSYMGYQLGSQEVNFLSEFCGRYNHGDDNKTDVEKIFADYFKDNMRENNVVAFKRAYPTLYNRVIIPSMKALLENMGEFTLKDMKRCYSQARFDQNSLAQVMYKEEKSYASFEEYMKSCIDGYPEIKIYVETEQIEITINGYKNQPKDVIGFVAETQHETRIKLTNGQPTLILK